MHEDEFIHRYYKEPLYPDVNRKVSVITRKLAKILAIAGIILVFIGFAPSVWYTFIPRKLDISKILKATFRKDKQTQFMLDKPKENVEIYQPSYDPNLPRENKLKISSVKIDTPINEASNDNYEEALKIGVWRVPDFGTPYERKLPTILAAHRYGYLKWSIPYRLKNSFYNLPKVKVGDLVEINWEQRKYMYEVYRESEGEEIVDYSSDLILYTCESLSSPIRIFKYARLLEI